VDSTFSAQTNSSDSTDVDNSSGSIDVDDSSGSIDVDSELAASIAVEVSDPVIPDSLPVASEGDSAADSPASLVSAPSSEAEASQEPAVAAPGGGSSAVATVAAGLLNPADGGDGPALPAESPAHWAAAAVARRDILPEPSSTQSVVSPAAATSEVVSAGLFTNPISLRQPVVPIVKKGIIQGNIDGVSSRGYELTYTVLENTTEAQGGKVDLIDSTKCQSLVQCASFFPEEPANSGDWTFLPDISFFTGGTGQFSVLIAENTDFDKFLAQLPVVGLFTPLILDALQRVPIVKDLLAPLIGYTKVEEVTLDGSIPGAVFGEIAFTQKVTSFDGVGISTNFFPACDSACFGGLVPASFSDKATILNGPGLGAAGTTAAFLPQVNMAYALPSIEKIREEDYNYVSWDPRGEYDSRDDGATLQLDSPFFEGRDVKAIIKYLVDNDLTAVEGLTPDGEPDPLIGMVGGSYGGGIQWVVAAIDQRVDAIVPGISWHSLNTALYPEDAFKTAWDNVLYLALTETDAVINSQIPQAILTGNLFGRVSEAAQAVLASSGPTVLVDLITAPAMVVQGVQDGLFVLQQANENAKITAANGIETTMVWFCGGHGYSFCSADAVKNGQTDTIIEGTMDWLDRYVRGQASPVAPRFQYFDQNGDGFSAALLPFETGFSGDPIPISGEKPAFMGFFPGIGGSGPSRKVPFPESILLSRTTASSAWNAVDLAYTHPESKQPTQVVGAPEVSFTYAGVGNAKFLYGQIVDDATGLVLGNQVQPIPVTLDGKTRTVKVKLENVVYTMEPGSSLTLQLTGSATVYRGALLTPALGALTVSDLELTLPTVADGVAKWVAPPCPGKDAGAPWCG